jgi:hypothetical protein
MAEKTTLDNSKHTPPTTNHLLKLWNAKRGQTNHLFKKKGLHANRYIDCCFFTTSWEALESLGCGTMVVVDWGGLGSPVKVGTQFSVGLPKIGSYTAFFGCGQS